jgi:tetratricopeptide (TPR) repeat protein
VRSVLDPDDPAESLVKVILAKAEGNPFFLEELARAVREHADLAVTGAVPDTIEAVISARIDRLATEDKQLLQAAAVVGKDVPLAITETITELPAEAVRKGLVRLKAAEFLYETRSGPEVEYTFKHALTHEVPYASLLPERRRGLHARILDGIEKLHAARLGEQVERLAHHAFRAETWEKAVGYARQAGTRALARSAHREAAAWFEQALGALGRLPDSRERLEQAIDLRLEVRTSLLPLGEFERIFEHLGQAEGLAKRLDDPQRLGRICAYLNDYFRQVGDYERAIESGRRGLAIAEARGDLPLRVATHIYLAHAYHNLGQYRSAIELLRRNVELLAGELSRERLDLPYVAAVHSRTWLVLCLAELGEFVEAVTQAEESLGIAEAADHPSSLISAHYGLGHVLLRRGELERGIPVLERGLELSRTWKIQLWFATFADELGSAYAMSGRLAEALPLLQQAVELHAATRGTAGQSVRLVSLAQAYVLAGRVAEASELSERALALARTHHERANEAYALRLCAEVAAQQLPAGAETAARFYRESLALAEELGMRPLLARGYLGLGQLYRRAGRPADAATPLKVAATLLPELGMRWWQRQVEAELAASG